MCSWVGPGFGNFLSVYFHSMLEHFSKSPHSPFNFEHYMNTSLIDKSKMKKIKNIKNLYIQQFLPSSISNCPLNINKSEQIIKNLNIPDIRYMDFHKCSDGILDNLHIIKPMFKQALDFYYSKFNIQPFIFNKNDVVIHFRTGDILHTNHPEYPCVHFHNYKTILNNKSIHNIYIIWKSERILDNSFPQRNTAVIDSLVHYLEKNVSISGKIIHTPHIYDDDFLFLVQAPTLITSVSTFSLWAALMNEGKSYVPQCLLHFNHRIFSNNNINVYPMKLVFIQSKTISKMCNDLFY